jgi:hypothetical protein
MDDQAEMTAKKDAARRARRLAWFFPDPADRDRALAYAAELDEQADALERRLEATGKVGGRERRVHGE